MIRRVAQVAVQRDGIELRIHDEEVLLQTIRRIQAAAFSSDAGAAIQEVSKLTDISIGDEGSRVRVRPQRCRSRNSRAVNSSVPEIQAPQHVVEQLSVASCARRIEGIEKSVVQNVNCIESFTIPELRGFRTDIRNAECQVPG